MNGRTLAISAAQSFMGVVILQALLTRQGTASASSAMGLAANAAARFLDPSVPAIGRVAKKTTSSSSTTTTTTPPTTTTPGTTTTTTTPPTTTTPRPTATRPVSTAPQTPVGGRPTTTGQDDTEDLPGHRSPIVTK